MGIYQGKASRSKDPNITHLNYVYGSSGIIGNRGDAKAVSFAEPVIAPTTFTIEPKPQLADYAEKAGRDLKSIGPIESQLRLANIYYNKLTEHSRARLAEYRRVRKVLIPERFTEIAELDRARNMLADRLDALYLELKQKQQQQRTRAIDDSTGIKSRISRLKQELVAHDKRCSAAVKGLNAYAAFRHVQQAADAVYNEANRTERKKSGLFHGTYINIEERVKAAFDRCLAEWTDPQFKPYKSEGSIGPQLKQSPTWADIQRGDGVDLSARVIRTCRVTGETDHVDIPADAGPQAHWPMRPDGVRPRAQLVELTIKIASQQGKPIKAVFVCKMHRPLPEGASIKRCYLMVTHNAWRPKWEVRFCLALPRTSSSREAATTGRVSLDVGWRKTPDGGLRVATWQGTPVSDEHGPIVIGSAANPNPYAVIENNNSLILTAAYCRRYAYVESLKSIRDNQFNEARDYLVDWIKANPSLPYPPEFIEATETLHAWLSPFRLARFMQNWKTRWRFAGDAPAFTHMWGERTTVPRGDGSYRNIYVGWYLQDRHLWEHMSGQAARCERQRKMIYRLFATELRKRWATVALESIDWSELARNTPAELDDNKLKVAEYNRRIAGVSYLTGKNGALALCGPTMQHVNPEYTTINCNSCGKTTNFKPKRKGSHTCEHCGNSWVKGENAAANVDTASQANAAMVLT